MKTKLSFIKLKAAKVFLLLLILFSFNAFSQTLVTYNFNNNVTPTGANAGINPFSLDYYDPVNAIIPNYFNNALQFVGSGDEVRFQFNGTNFSGLNVSFNGWAGALGFGGITVNIKAYLKVGAATEIEIADQDITANYIAYNEEPFSISLPTADNQANVQVRIVGTILDAFGLAFRGFGIDKLVLSSQSPKIQPYGYNTSNTLASIPENGFSATRYGTDFGIVNTDDTVLPNASTRVFRITNSGTAALQISGITFSGDSPEDFNWVTSPPTPAPSTPSASNALNSFPATVVIGASRDFVVKFNPSQEGKRSAILNILSNADPSPYSFFVEGRGATCKTEDLFIKRNTVETSQPADELLATTGDFKSISGTSLPNAHTASEAGLNTIRLYPNSNSTGNGSGNTYNLFTSPNTSWYIRNSTSNLNFTSTMEFGAVNVANEKGVYISFNLAAFSTATTTDFNNSDYVELQVLKPGTTGTDPSDWSSELRVRGGNAANENSRYSFAGGATASTFYDGDNAPLVFTNGNNLAGKNSKIQLKLPGSANFQNVIFRIVGYNSTLEKLWLIDDVAVYSANAVFRTYKSDGTWRDSGNNSVAAPDETTQTYKNFKTIFDANYTIPVAGLTICECEVNNNINLTIPPNTRLTVQTGITNLGNGSNFIVNDVANLIQVEDGAANNGDITAQKLFTFTVPYAPTPNRQQYNYVISPVVGQNLKTIYLGNPTTLFHIESTNNFGTSSGAYIPGRALAVKEPATSFVGANSVTAEFKGVPFNGELAYALAYTTSNSSVSHGYNLVGNPYPSNLDLQKLYDYNRGGFTNKNVIDPTFQFWDNRGNTQLTQQGSSYDGANYAKFNVINGTGVPAGGTAAPFNPNPPNPLPPARIPTQFVKVGTGFMVRAKNTANGQPLYFNNSMRSSDNTGPGFFGKEGSKDRFWLSFTTPTEMQFMNAVVYFPNGNNAYGLDDSDAFSSSERIYSIVDEHEIAIQGRAPFTLDDKVDLGFSAFVSGTHTISIYNKEGVFDNGQTIYLKDKQTGTITNLTENSYTFEANAGESTGRFEIIYKPETVLVTDSVVKDGLAVYRDGENFVIQSHKTIALVQVYDLSGKLITVLKANHKKAILDASFFIKGMYVLRIKTADGEIANKKIIKQ